MYDRQKFIPYLISMIIFTASSKPDSHSRSFFSILSSFHRDWTAGKLPHFSFSDLSSQLNSAYRDSLNLWIASLRRKNVKVQIHEWFFRSVCLGGDTLVLCFCRIRFPEFHTTSRVLPHAMLPYSSLLERDALLLLRDQVKYSSSGISENLFCSLLPEEAEICKNRLSERLSVNRWLSFFLKSTSSSLADSSRFEQFQSFRYGKRKLRLIICRTFRTAPDQSDLFPAFS